MATRYKLNPGQTITVTVGEGRAHVRSLALGVSAFTRSAVSFGPYLVASDWLIDGDATVVMADYAGAFNALLYPHHGAPEDAAQATLAVNPAGDDNGLIFTARVYGAEGNSISVRYVDPDANDAALSVSLYRQAITVSLATGEAGAITSTAAEIKAAIEAKGDVAQLVTVALDEDDDNFSAGAGIVTAMATAALEDGAGTGIGVVVRGGLLIDTENGDVYRNSGSQAAPAWTQLADVS